MPNSIKTILIIIFTLSILGAFSIASGAFNEQINYQGKLTDSSSIPVANGDHCMKFRLMDALTNGSELWSETLDQASGNCKKPTTTNGLFSVMLGKCNVLNTVDFNQTGIYLEVQYDPDCAGWDEIFSPRKHLGAVPAAFETKQLGGKAETAFGTLSESEAVIGAWTFSDILTVTEVPTGALVNQGSLYINPATAAADYTLFGLAIGGAEKFRVDEDGDVAIEGDISFTGSQTISTTVGDLVLNPAENLALSSNNITGLGTGITASGALTISITGANNLTLTPGTGLTTTGSTFQITGGLLDVNTYADIAYSGATTALTITQSGTGAIVDFTNTVAATSGAFTLTNLGSGNSFLVEDSASADSTPFVIDADGNVGIGISDPHRKLSVSGDAVIEDNLISTQDNGIYFGRTRISENQWGIYNSGNTWVAKDSSRDWGSIAMSSDGKYQTATVENGNIYVSSDYGNTWTAKDSSRLWYDVSMSSDGKYQTATVENGNIYVSSDYGSTWTAKDSSRNWSGIAISSDGKYQTAGVYSGGNIYVSSDYGSTWTAKDSSRWWGSIAISSDGKYQTAAVQNGNIYVSSDYGNTWTAKDSSRLWHDVSMSSDGKYQTAAVGSSNIYISSDYGNTWAAKDSSRLWRGIAMSSDGKYQTAAVQNGNIYVSSDYGNTWTAKDSSKNWLDVAMSSDGKYQTITVENGNIYVSYADSITHGNVGIGTTAPGAKLEVETTDGDNKIGMIVDQNDVTNNPVAFQIENAGTGNALTIDQDGNVGTAIETDGALFVENTGNTDIGLNIYSNIGATSAAGLVYFTADNTGFNQTVLTIGQDGTGNILDIQKSGSSVFEVTQSLVKVSQPLQVNVAGDVGFSRSVEFTSTGESHIYSEGPFIIAAGDPNSAENLTLTTRTTEELAETGDVTSATASYIIDTGQTSWVNDEFVGGRIEITAGPGIGEIREICANAASDDDRITACSNFTITPTTASDYSVYRKAGDILVNIGGTNMTSGGFKVLGMDTNAIFRISSEGDVGIGTMSPAYALDIKSRSTVGTAFFVDGGGAVPDLDDITTGGTFIGATALDYMVRIDAEGTPDTFEWDDDGELTVDQEATGVSITGSAQDLNNGVTITFAATTGHDLADYWDFSTTVTNPFAIQNAAGTRSLSVGNDGKITYSSTDGPKRTIILTAAGAIIPTADGAAQTKVDGTNTYYVLDFDADAVTGEDAFWQWTMPDSYDDGTIDITYYWTAVATTNDVVWCFQARGASAAEAVDAALSTAVCEVGTAPGTTMYLVTTTESAAASNFTKSEYVAFRVYRDSNDGADDMAGDARLLKVKIEYSVSSESD